MPDSWKKFPVFIRMALPYEELTGPWTRVQWLQQPVTEAPSANQEWFCQKSEPSSLWSAGVIREHVRESHRHVLYLLPPMTFRCSAMRGRRGTEAQAGGCCVRVEAGELGAPLFKGFTEPLTFFRLSVQSPKHRWPTPERGWQKASSAEPPGRWFQVSASEVAEPGDGCSVTRLNRAGTTPTPRMDRGQSHCAWQCPFVFLWAITGGSPPPCQQVPQLTPSPSEAGEQTSTVRLQNSRAWQRSAYHADSPSQDLH